MGVSVAQSRPNSATVTETDFLADLPLVLSVSRLAQRLDETPGAVTILDRDFIRRSGARDLTDLLRVVPGFQTTTTFETDAPMASYHGRNDDFSNRIQVLVDGRSVYSTYLQGSSGLGLQTLALDDIERVEILRGSNSAAYGARAFLGVINIVSRDPNDTVGGSASLTTGDNRVADGGMHVGWGETDAVYRVSADSRSDAGLRGAYGANLIQRANFAAQWMLDPGRQLDFKAGALQVDAGRGEVGSNAGNAARIRSTASQFMQLDWRQNLDADTDLVFGASHTENIYSDNFKFLDPQYYTYFGIPIDFSGHEFHDVLSVQATRRMSPQFRFVVGSELRTEKLVSPSSFSDRKSVDNQFFRVFGNAEWRIVPSLILNAGALAENSELDGNTFAPRLMLNWHVTDVQTLRAGVSSAFRPPSAYERFANVRYYDVNGTWPIVTYYSTGQVSSEKIYSTELGYQLIQPALGIDLDVRAFHERIVDGIERPVGVEPTDYANIEGYQIGGAELQVGWRPDASTRIFASYTRTDVLGMPAPLSNNDSHPFRVTNSVPKSASSLSIMHTFSNGLDVTLIYNDANDVALMSPKGQLQSMVRTDIRIARDFRLGQWKSQWAFTVQNLNAPYADGDRKYYFDQRAFLTLRTDF
jgi:iron complex outermembrane receptor protein